MRSSAAASGGGGGQGLAVSLLEAFIERHQADVQRCLSQEISPATGTFPICTLGRGWAAHLPHAAMQQYTFLSKWWVERVPELCASLLLLLAGMLVRNYRSHSSLLQIPNRLFYHDSLLVRTSRLHRGTPRSAFPLPVTCKICLRTCLHVMSCVS